MPLCDSRSLPAKQLGNHIRESILGYPSRILFAVFLGLMLAVTGCTGGDNEDNPTRIDFPTSRPTATLPPQVTPGPDCLNAEGRHPAFEELIKTHLTNPVSLDILSTRIDPYNAQVFGYPIVVTFIAKDDAGNELVHTAIGDVSPYTCVANLTDLF